MLPPVVGQLRIEAEEGLQGLRKAPQAMRETMSRTADEVERGGRTITARGKVAGQEFGEGYTRDATGRLKDAQGRFVQEGEKSGEAVTRGAKTGVQRGSGGILSTMRNALGGVAGITAGLGVGAVLFSGIKKGLQSAAAREQAIIGFDTLMPGGIQVAKQFYGQLQQFAAQTPFELPGVVDAARQLMGVGQSAKTVLPFLRDFGDASSALGLSQDQFSHIMMATTQSMANGKIQAGDMLQITQAGLPIWSLLSQALGKPVAEVRKLSEGGKLLTADVLPKLQAQMHKDYGGAMVRQSQTLAGVWSTVEDTISMALGNALQPLVPMLTNILPRAATMFSNGLGTMVHWLGVAWGAAQEFWGVLSGSATDGPNSMIVQLAYAVQELYNYMKPGISAVIGGFMTAFHLLTDAMSNALPVATAVVNFFSQYSEILAPIATGVLAGVAAFKIWTTTVAIAQAITEAYTTVMAALDVVMDANPVMLIVIALAALVAGLVYAYNHSTTFKNAVDAMAHGVMIAFRWIMTAVRVTVDFVKSYWPLIIGAMIGPVGIVVALVLTHMGMIRGFLGNVASWFAALPGRVWAGIQALPRVVNRALELMLNLTMFALGFMLGLVVKSMIDLVTQTIHALHVLPGLVGHLFMVMGRETVRSSIETALAVAAAFMALVNAVASTLYNLPGRVSSIFHSVWSTAVSVTTGMVHAVLGFFRAMPGQASDSISSMPGKIKAVFSNAGSWLLSAGRDMVMGLVSGIQGAMGSAVSAAKNAAMSAVHGFKSALGISSPSKVIANQVGRFIPPGLEVGVQAALPASVRRVSGMLASAMTRTVGPGASSPSMVHALPVQAGGGSDRPLEVTVKVILDGRVLFETMQREALRYGKRNPNNGLNLLVKL